MAKKITSNDLFESNLFTKQKDEALAFLNVLQNLEAEYKDILDVQSKILNKSGDNNDLQILKQRSAAVKEIAKVEKELLSLEKEKAGVEQQLQKLDAESFKTDQQRTKAAKELINLQKQEESLRQSKIRTQEAEARQQKRLNNEKKKAAKIIKDESSQYKQLSIRVNEAQAEFKELAAAFGVNSKQAKTAAKNLDRVQKELREIDVAARDGRRNVGNYTTAFGGLGKGLKGIGARFLAVTGLIYGLGRALVSSFKTFRDFQQETAKLASVLGKSRKEIKALTDDAKRLGASTVFTASQVTKLQVAFSKLGFNEDQILNATEATLALAAATGTDLEESATVAAQTLNGFGLEADQTQRVVDVMAKSFTSTALDMQKFSTAMAAVAPVAKTAGVSIERTTALLGTLVDAGVDASTAGTGLRNIFLDLAKSGLTFDQAMDKIQKSSNKNATALDLFGKRGATVATILSETTDKADDLTDAFNNAGGAAQEMADTQLDTLQGSITKLSSAWEGFILGLEDGDGVIAKTFKGFIDFVTESLNVMTRFTRSASQNEDADLSTLSSSAGGFATERLQKINELATAHLDTLKDISESNDKWASSAKKILILRDKGLEKEEIIFAISAKNALNAQSELETKREILKTDKKQIGNAIFTTSELEKNIAQLEGLKETYKETAKIKLQQLSTDKLQNLIASDLDDRVRGMALFELNRRKQLGEVIDENNEKTKTSVNSTKEEVKEVISLVEERGNLNELVKERNDLEKELNKELKLSGGLETAITEDLRERIKLQDDLIKAQRIGAGTTAEQGGLDELDTRGVPSIDEALEDYKSKLKEKEDAENEAIEKEKEQFRDRLNAAQDFYNKLVEMSNQRIDKELDNINKEVDASKERENQLKEIAAAGQLDAQQSLKSEIQKQSELERQRQELEARKQRRETISTGLDLLATNLQNGAQGGDAVSQTLRQMTTLIALLSNIQGFYTGTDYAPEGLAWTDEKGAEIHLDKHGNVKDWGSNQGAQLKYLQSGDKILTAEQSKIVKSQLGMQPILEQKEIKLASISNNADIVQAVLGVKNSVDNKPVQRIDYDPIERAIVDQMKGNNKLMKKHISNKPKFM